MYRETQDDLRVRGISEVLLYRGVREPYDPATAVGVIESWTSDYDVAVEFAGPTGEVWIERITATRILAWYDGPGWVNGPKGSQFEWLILSEEPR
jgi:hypothetical protein